MVIFQKFTPSKIQFKLITNIIKIKKKRKYKKMTYHKRHDRARARARALCGHSCLAWGRTPPASRTEAPGRRLRGSSAPHSDLRRGQARTVPRRRHLAPLPSCPPYRPHVGVGAPRCQLHPAKFSL